MWEVGFFLPPTPYSLLPYFKKSPRTDLLSQAAARLVPSALARFTSEFGMDSGGSTPLWARGETGF